MRPATPGHQNVGRKQWVPPPLVPNQSTHLYYPQNVTNGVKDFFDADRFPGAQHSSFPAGSHFSDRWKGYDSLSQLDPLGARVSEHPSQREPFTRPSSGMLPAHQTQEWCTLISSQWVPVTFCPYLSALRGTETSSLYPFMR